jgi:hypothetical protein
LPPKEKKAPEWHNAVEALLLVAKKGGPTMFARIGFMGALSRHVERVFNPDRKAPSLGPAQAEARALTTERPNDHGNSRFHHGERGGNSRLLLSSPHTRT